MSTNPLGKGTQNIAVNVPKTLRDELASLAEQSGLSLSSYCRLVLEDAKEKNLVLKVTGG